MEVPEEPEKPEIDTTRYDNYFVYEADFECVIDPRTYNPKDQSVQCNPSVEFNLKLVNNSNAFLRVNSKLLVVAYILKSGQTTIGPIPLTEEFRNARIKFFKDNLTSDINNIKLYPINTLGVSYYTRNLDLNVVEFEDKFDLNWYLRNKDKGGLKNLKYISRGQSFYAKIIEAPYEDNYISQAVREDLVNFEVVEKMKAKIRFSSRYKLLPDID